MARASAVAKTTSNTVAADPARIPPLSPSLQVDAASASIRAPPSTDTDGRMVGVSIRRRLIKKPDLFDPAQHLYLHPIFIYLSILSWASLLTIFLSAYPCSCFVYVLAPEVGEDAFPLWRRALQGPKDLRSRKTPRSSFWHREAFRKTCIRRKTRI